MAERYIVLLLFLCFLSWVKCDETFEKRLLALEKVIQIQRDEIGDLKSEVNELKRENMDIKIQVNTLKEQLRDNQFIKPDDGFHHNTQEKTGDSESTLKTPANVELIHNSTVHNAALGTRDVRRRGSAETPIAFYAVINGGPCLHDHAIIVFNQEITDVGNGYNQNDGIYVVPTSGYYVFVWTIASRDDWYVSELAINGVGKAHTFTDTVGDTDVSQVTGIAIYHVNAGDHVFIRKITGTGCNVHDTSYHLTSFSGWLLF